MCCKFFAKIMRRIKPNSSVTQVVCEEPETEPEETSTSDVPDGHSLVNTTTSVSQRWKSCNLGRQNNQDICELFSEFLGTDIDEEKRQECIDKIEFEELDGSTLLSICNDTKQIDHLKKRLNFKFKYEVCFNKMMEFIKSRNAELGGASKPKSKETFVQKKADRINSKVRTQASTSGTRESVTGVRLNVGKNLNAKFGKILAKGDGNVSAVDIEAKGNATVESQDVTADKTNENDES